MTNDETEMSKIYFTLSHANGNNVEFTPEQAKMMIEKYIQQRELINKLYMELSSIYEISKDAVGVTEG